MSITLKRKRDKAVDAARTMLWFAFLSMRLGLQRPREIHLVVDKASLQHFAGEVNTNHKFLGYSRGDNVPRAQTIQKVESAVPQSASVINNIFWNVLRFLDNVEENARTWSGQFPLFVQEAVTTRDNRFSDDEHTVETLLRRPCLESLTALTIIYQRYLKKLSIDSVDESKNAYHIRRYAVAIFRMLMMVSPVFLTEKIQNHVFEIYVERVFHRAGSEKYESFPMNFNGYDFASESRKFLIEASKLEISLPSSQQYYSPQYQCELSTRMIARVINLIRIPVRLSDNDHARWQDTQKLRIGVK